jgi:hypothetical protein
MQSEREIRRKRFLEQRRAVFEKNRPFIEELKTIPHLKLETAIDLPSIQSEFTQVDRWAGNVLASDAIPESYRKHHFEILKGQVLIGTTEDSDAMVDTSDNFWNLPETRFDEEGRVQYSVTTMGKRLPRTEAWLRSFMREPGITRINRLEPLSEVAWHSHHNSDYFREPEYMHGFAVTVIQAEHGVWNQVRGFRNDDRVFSCEYRPGQTFLFNSWHNHRLVNMSARHRVSVLHFFDLWDEANLKLLSRPVEEYRGPRLES